MNILSVVIILDDEIHFLLHRKDANYLMTTQLTI
jgi:hypothetical protein